MLKARSVIRHDIVLSRDEEGAVAVAICPLVLALVVAETRIRSIARDRSTRDSGDGRCIIRAREDGGVGDVVRGGDQRELGEDAGMFKVAVGDRTARVVRRDHVALDVSRERVAPDVWVVEVVKVHPAHASFGRVGSAQDRGIFRHDFR